MIATTIISSMRVKPCWLFFMVYPLGVIENFTCRVAPTASVLRQPCDTARAGEYTHIACQCGPEELLCSDLQSGSRIGAGVLQHKVTLKVVLLSRDDVERHFWRFARIEL
jgi:hypothetical protein